MKNIAIIGTAGRDKTKPMTLALWAVMVKDAAGRFTGHNYRLISGGAAWADHLAVELFLADRNRKLTLHMPAPFNIGACEFEGGYGTSGGTANFYHDKFDVVLGYRARAEIQLAIGDGAMTTDRPVVKGYAAMYDRNKLVAADADFGMLAYTWGEGDEPADGGTLLTWNHHKKVHPNARRVHVPLRNLL